jgi:anti-anti-sigma factor
MSVSRADLHIHTSYSDGLPEPEATVNYAAARTQLQVIAITDHNTLDGAWQAHDYCRRHRDTFGHLEVIIGEEVSSHEGHILGLFLRERVPPGLSAEDTIRAIHERGGIAIAAHPFTHLLRFRGLKGVGTKIAELPLDAVEVRNSVPTEVYANLITKAYNAQHRGHTPVGGSDCHYLPMIGRAYTFFEGSTAQDLRAALLTGAARPGGGVNGPLTVGRFVRDHVRHRQLPAIRVDDQHYRYAAPHLTVEVEELVPSRIVVLHCAGHITRDNASILHGDVSSLLNAGLSRLVVDLENVVDVDSVGWGVLLGAQKRSQSLGGDLALCALTPHVAVTLKLQHLGAALCTHDTTHEATRALGGTVGAEGPAVEHPAA